MPKENLGIWSTLKEIIGRVEEPSVSFDKMKWEDIFKDPTQDTSRPIYGLNMSIYKASIVKDISDGKRYGADYIFGATFGKPIVNSVAAFAFSGLNPPKIAGDSDFHDDTNNFLFKNRKTLFDAMRFGSRDGDSYARFMASGDDVYLDTISPDLVTVLTAEDNVNEIIGYDIDHIVAPDKKNKNKKKKIREEYRFVKPYYRRVVIDEKGVEEEVSTDNGFPFMSMFHYANEKDSNALYGTSDYQNVYSLMKGYHIVMETMVKGTVYNSQPTPIVEGIKNFSKFLSSNFASTGKTRAGEPRYKIDWNQGKIMLLGEGTKMSMLTIPDHVTPASKTLELLFYCICQASETPEFVMGTAVASSRASVSEQLPVMVNKAYRKRADFEDFLYDVLDAYIQYRLATGTKQSDVPQEIMIEWPPIESEDRTLTFEILKALREMGVITDETALMLSGVKIEDVNQEIQDAKKQALERSVQEARQADIYSPFSAQQQEDEDIKEMTRKDTYKSKRKVKKPAHKVHKKK